MTEEYRSDTDLTAMQNAAHGPGVWFYLIGEKPWTISYFKALSRIADALIALCGMEAYKDGDLTFGVRAGRFMDGATTRDYAGSTANALTNNQTNYIYLTAAGALVVNITGFPDAATTAHVPLATIVTAAGAYAHDDITDYRGRAIFRPANALTPAEMTEAHDFFAATDITGAQAETLSDGSNADALHVHDTAGLEADAVDGTKIADDAVAKEHIAADVAGDGLAQSGTGALDVNVDDSTIEVSADTLQLKDGGIGNAKIASDAAIAATKLIHQVPIHYSQADGSDVVAAIVPVHTVYGTTGTIVGVEAVCVDAPSGGDKKFTVDLKKCNAGSPTPATVLTGVIDYVNGTNDCTVLAGSISSASLADGDTLVVEIAVSGSTGSQGQGLIVTVTIQEDPQ